MQPIEALSRLREIGLSFGITQCMFAAVHMGVFDRLNKQSSSAEELAKYLDIHPMGCIRLLVVLRQLDLVVRDKDQFSLTELGTYLISNSPYGMSGLAKVDNLVPMWGHLPKSLSKNGPVWEETFGASSEEIFTELYKDPAALRRFCDYMDSYSITVGGEIADRYDFSGHSCILDVAGGPCGVTRSILKKHLHLKGIGMDLPEVLEVAQERIAEDGLSERFRTETADLFEGPYPQGADVIMLSWILHDWSDDNCRRILGHCFDALPSGGVLLLSESVMHEDYSGPSVWPEIYSLFMLVACESGGRERPFSEHKSSLEGTGFRDIELMRSEGPRDLIVAHKS